MKVCVLNEYDIVESDYQQICLELYKFYSRVIQCLCRSVNA